MDGDLVEIGLVGQRVDGDAVLFGIADQVLDGEKLGNIMAGLAGQGQTGVIGGQSLLDVLLDGARDAAFATVVGRQRQLPVAEIEIQLAQVVERSPGAAVKSRRPSYQLSCLRP